MRTIYRTIGIEQFINRNYPIIRTGINDTIEYDDNGCPIAPNTVDIEDYINENPAYGNIDKSSMVFPISLTQTLDDMGLYTDFE